MPTHTHNPQKGIRSTDTETTSETLWGNG
jgi:hypothetical protein